MRTRLMWLVGGLGVLLLLLSLSLLSGEHRSPDPPDGAEVGRASSAPDLVAPGAVGIPDAGGPRAECQIVDRNGVPVRGNGSTPPPRASARPGRFVVWVEGVDDGSADCVQPNPEGQFVPPAESPERRVRLLALDPTAPGDLLVSDAVWQQGDLAGSRVVLSAPPAVSVQIGCRDDQGRWIAGRVRIARKIGQIEHQTIARIELPASIVRVNLDSGPGKYMVFLDQSEGATVEHYIPERRDLEIDRFEDGVCIFDIGSGAVFTVALVDHEGGPLQGAGVVLKYVDGGIWRVLSQPPDRVTEGAFRFSGLPAGEYILQIAAPGHAPQAHRLTLAAGENSERRFLLQKGGATIRGTLSRSDGAPLPEEGWSLFLLRRGSSPEAVQAFWTGRFARPGRFEASGLSVGEYELRLNRSSMSLTLIVNVAGGDVDLGAIDLDPVLAGGDCSVAVIVTCESRLPLSLTVLYRNALWPEHAWKTVDVRNGAGPERIAGLAPGIYDFQLSPAGLDPSKFDLGDRARVEVSSGAGNEPGVLLDIPVLR